MSFKDALGKAKCKGNAKCKGKTPSSDFAAGEENDDMPEKKPNGKKGGFMQAAKNAKKKSKNKCKK